MAGFDVEPDGNFSDITAEIGDDIAGAAMSTMKAVSLGLKTELRQEVVAAGLGQRLANTWRVKTYPEGKSKSIDATAFAWSKAPDIIDAFSRGATIVPVNGSKYLAIPTSNVPKKGRGRKMTPLDVETTFNQDLQFGKSDDGTLFAYVDVIRAKNGRGFRRPTLGRLKAGRQVQSVLMFFMIPRAKMPKLFDLDAKAETWGAKAIALFDEKLK